MEHRPSRLPLPLQPLCFEVLPSLAFFLGFSWRSRRALSTLMEVRFPFALVSKRHALLRTAPLPTALLTPSGFPLIGMALCPLWSLSQMAPLLLSMSLLRGHHPQTCLFPAVSGPGDLGQSRGQPRLSPRQRMRAPHFPL